MPFTPITQPPPPSNESGVHNPPNPRSVSLSQRVRKLQRNLALRQRFLELYDQRRLRIDDVFALLAEEFFLSPRTVARLLQENDTRKRAEEHYL